MFEILMYRNHMFSYKPANNNNDNNDCLQNLVALVRQCRS